MNIETNLPFVEEMLGKYRDTVGADYEAYRNHVYRVINLCLSTGNYRSEEREKIQIAGCFHDLGIWTDVTLDYLLPSEREASNYLAISGRESWIPEITRMIDMHHRIRSCEVREFPLVEAFRRADIADFSLGLFRMGLSLELVEALKVEFPNRGFHKRLLQLGFNWFLRHPLNPLPMFHI